MTKAREFENLQARAAQAGHPRRTARRKSGPTIPKEGVTIDHNRSAHAGRRGGAQLEESATGKPSRKSTRRSSDHPRRTTNQQLQQVRKISAPSSRARARR